jgi:PAS domain S-box-containing protein
MADHCHLKSSSTGPSAAASGSHGRDPAEIEARLRTLEAQFRSVVEGSTQGIVIQQDGRVVYANPAMARLFGFATPEEVVGLNPFEDLIGEPDLTVFRQRTDAVYRGETVAPTPPWRARPRDGRELWISSAAHRTEWFGKPAVVSFYVDVTVQRRAEQALRLSEDLYRSALSAGRMGAWETDLVARTRTWTAEGQALFGLSLPDGHGTVGGPDDEYLAVLHPEDRHLVAGFYAAADTLDEFPAEYRIVRPDGQMLWLSGRGRVLSRQPDGRAHRLVNIMADITDRKARELHIQFLLREMTHRSKNLLAVVMSLAARTARTTASLADFQERFSRRIQGLAASHEVLVRETWRGAPMRELIREQLVPFIDPAGGRVSLEGPNVTLKPDAAQAIGLAVHELATNAVKYGALSVPAGRVSIRWSLGDVVELVWQEQNGPQVVPPRATGFGHVVVHQITEAALDGHAETRFETTGLIWSVKFPKSSLVEARPDAPAQSGGQKPD